jgi:hypothetical protein
MSEEKLPIIEDWWMDWQKAIVLDTSRKWILKTFKNSAGYSMPSPDGSTLVGKVSETAIIPTDSNITEGLWDHEHCRLCWETISEYEGQQHEGYTDGKDWICIHCYQKYFTISQESK